jgi:hypothetical protein
MRKLIFIGMLIAGAYGVAKLYLHYKVSDSVDDVILMLSPMADVQYSGISSTMGGTLSIDDVEINVHGYSGPVSIDKISLMTPGFFHLLSLGDMGRNMASNEMPESLAFGFTGLKTSLDTNLVNMLYAMRQQSDEDAGNIDVAAECTGRNGYSPEMLRRLGYSDIVVDAQFGYRSENGEVVLESATVVEDMYTTNIEVTLQGTFSPQAMAMGDYRPRLVNAKLEYIDDSLDRRTTELCADRGLSADEIRAAKLETFNDLGERTGIVFDEQIIAPFVEFLNGKTSFVLSANPIEPVNLGQIGLYKPSDVPALLNLTAAAH